MIDDGDATRDLLFGGAVVLHQPRTGHRAGTDALLLAGLAPVRPGDAVVDFGSASGAVGLVVAGRAPGTTLRLVERDPALVALARRNIVENGLDGRATAVEADLFAPRATRAALRLAEGDADLVVTNPPFFEAGARASPDPGRHAAHVLDGGDLTLWLAAAADCLRHRGRLALIHRADRLDLCLAALGAAFGSPAVRPIYSRDGDAATRILLIAVKGGRAPFSIAPPLVLHAPDGGFTPEALRLHGRDVSG